VLKSPSPGATLDFDELNLEVEIEYDGVPVELASRPPSIDDIGSEESVLEMAGGLVRQYADRVRIKARSGSLPRCNFISSTNFFCFCLRRTTSRD
jgi:hypothetical protein